MRCPGEEHDQLVQLGVLGGLSAFVKGVPEVFPADTADLEADADFGPEGAGEEREIGEGEGRAIRSPNVDGSFVHLLPILGA